MFLEPQKVNVKREPKVHYVIRDGVTCSLGVELTTRIMSQVLRAMFEFDHVRRTPGLAGHLNRLNVTPGNTLRCEYSTGYPQLKVSGNDYIDIYLDILSRR